MPMPDQSAVHINVPLTNVSIAYAINRDDFIANKVFPSVPVEKQSDLYWKYSKSDLRRTDAKRRAPSTESPGTGWNRTTDSYFCHVYAVHHDIDDQLRANADSVFSLDKEATQFITNQLLLKRDIDWHSTYFKEGVWGTNLTGVESTPSTNQFIQWSSASSDPVAYLDKMFIEFVRQNGMKPNTLVIGPDVLTALKNHPGILDRIKYTQKGFITEDMLASMLGVKRVLTTWPTVTTGPQIPDAKAQDAAAQYNFIGDTKSALLCYTPDSPSLMTPAAGYTFTWKGYLGGNAQGVLVKNFRMEHIRSDRIEAEMTYDMKIVGKDLGVFMKNVVK